MTAQRDVWRSARRSEVSTSRFMIAAKHPLICQAASDIWNKGGNVVDAAVAASFAACVVEPGMTGVGGEGVMLISARGGEKTTAIDFVGRTPSDAGEDFFEIDSKTRTGMFGWPHVKNSANLEGYRAVTVPGLVHGMWAAHETFGKMPFDELLEPAIRYAESGFEVGWHTALQIAFAEEKLAIFPESSRLFLKNGHFPKPAKKRYSMAAEIIVQSELAGTLRSIAKGGVKEFYQGDLAKKIVSEIKKGGGVLALSDFENYHADVYDAESITYRDKVVRFDPRHGGITMAEILKIMEGYDASTWGPTDPQFLLAFMKSAKFAYTDRLGRLGDPNRSTEYRQLLSDENVRKGRETAARGLALLDLASSGDHTTHICLSDGDGNMVSIGETLVDCFGSGVTIPGTGIVMNDGMSAFDPEPGHPNSLGPSKERLHNITPALVFNKNGSSLLNTGAPGGRAIPITVAQVIIHVLDFGMSVQEAVESPRVMIEGRKFYLDSRYPESTIVALKKTDEAVEEIRKVDYNFAVPIGIAHVDGKLYGGVDLDFPFGVESAVAGA